MMRARDIPAVRCATTAQGLDLRLREAASRGEVEALEGILAAGADPNAPNLGGNTALHYAAWADSPRAVAALIAAGANPELRNVYGATPLDIALRDGRAAAAGALRET